MSSDYFSDVKTEISSADIANLKRMAHFQNKQKEQATLVRKISVPLSQVS